MLQRQKEEEEMYRPAQIEAVLGMLSAAHPDQSPSTWDVLREALGDGLQSIDRRLERYGPLDANRFSLKEANRRLANLMKRRYLG